MEASRVFETLTIRSHKGPYEAQFREGLFSELTNSELEGRQFIIDAKVARLYEPVLRKILGSGRALLIEATEENKSIERFSGLIQKLVAQNVRRGDMLVAIGGGIIQDITCFFAATMFRGLDWTFYPTTLLAQADSCIGSKSSVNVGDIKNLLGTFTPARRVCIDPAVLKTLSETEIRSGVGEMLKIHIIDGPASFDQIAADYDRLMRESSVLLHYVHRSLLIKKRFIEEDEFDKGIRNVLNYGHSFGHAIEAATEFGIPHGVAVTLGMDMANFVAFRMGLSSREHFERMHSALKKNYQGYEATSIPQEQFFSGLSKDKKNTASQLGLILPQANGIPTRQFVTKDEAFVAICSEFLNKERTR
jgi:3-dehydroquinate synthase